MKSGLGGKPRIFSSSNVHEYGYWIKKHDIFNFCCANSSKVRASKALVRTGALINEKDI
jgi:hypothetical protein